MKKNNASRKKTTPVMQNGEEEYRELFNHMLSGVAVWEAVDGGGDFILRDMNFRGAELSRVDIHDVLGKRATEAFPAIVRMGLLDVLRRVWRTGESEFLSASFYDSQNNPGWFENSVYKLPNGTVVAVYDDVTERENAYDALRKSESMLNEVGRIAKIGGWEMDLITRKATWTEGTYHIVEIELDELIPGPDEHVDYYLPEYRPMVIEAMRALIEKDKPLDFEAQLRTAKGNIIWCRAIGRAERKDGKCVRVYGTFQDITERKKAQEALHASQKKFRSIVENIGIGVALISPKMEILEINRQMRMWYPDIQPGENVLCYRHFNDPPRSEVCSYCPTIKTLRDGRVHEAIAETPVGGNQIRYYRVLASPLLDSQGRVTAVIEMVDDITEKKKLEEQFLQAQKMEAIGRLAGGVAHDFRNQLTVIKGYGEILLQQHTAEGRACEELKEILKAADRAALQTSQLLAFSRKVALQPRVVGMAKMVADIGKLLPRFVGEDVRLHIVDDSQDGNIFVDSGQFQQAIINLIANARDAMPRGGDLTIQTFVSTPDDAFFRRHPDLKPGPYVGVAVTDTGCGIDEAAISNLFEPFFTTKTMGEGTGLGLAMVYGFVKQSGGAIEVESTPGESTTFRLYFPQAFQTAGTIDAPMNADAPSGGTETILVAEDEVPIRRLLVMLLREAGYTVYEAADAKEAGLLFERHSRRIDALVTDVVMPGGSGVELVERIREVRPEIPVLFVSGYGGRELARRGVEPAGDPVIHKPYSREDILNAVRRLLDDRTAER